MTFRLCPKCNGRRPIDEINCEGNLNGLVCDWLLINEPIIDAEAINPPQDLDNKIRQCANGHDVDPDDEICIICGSQISSDNENDTIQPLDTSDVNPTIINGWVVEREVNLSRVDEPWSKYVVLHSVKQLSGQLTLYNPNSEPDNTVYESLRRMSLEHIPELLETGIYNNRTYEVVELIRGGSLKDCNIPFNQDPTTIEQIIRELTIALTSFADIGLRHRDLRPETILIRSFEPLDLVISGFGSARLSDFDLEAVSPLEITRYSAPEAIVGAVTAASDWWSLGMILLEIITNGLCFQNINDHAFRIHVVTRGIKLPSDLDARFKPILRGLLTRDPAKRWGGSEVSRWLEGQSVVFEDSDDTIEHEARGPSISLAGRDYFSPEELSLAAAEENNWLEARQLTVSGKIATWLHTRDPNHQITAEVRRITTAENINENFKHSLVLMALNQALPMILEGVIVTPSWLLENRELGFELISGDVIRYLERMKREDWLVRLGGRIGSVKERARLLEIKLDEERLKISLLATSRANLEAERNLQRKIYPDTEHAGIASIIDKSRIVDDDIIIIISASQEQFIPIDTLINSTLDLAERLKISINRDFLHELFPQSRRDIFAQVEARIVNFSRCNNTIIDEWADTFRIEKRLPLPRAAILLSIAPEEWKEPPKQQYVANLLEYFEKRVTSAIGRGPLVRFTIGKTTPRIDIFDLGTAIRPSDAILNHILSRVEVPLDLDPQGYLGDPLVEARLRKLTNHSQTFLRDTGIDGRYLAYPFVILRDQKQTAPARTPRVAPVLLWPIRIDLVIGPQGRASLMFDRDREEVKINPALESLIGTEAFIRWKKAQEELLQRPNIRFVDVIDAFSSFVRPRSHIFEKVPGKDTQSGSNVSELIAAAALFNAEFTGQAVATDLRRMRQLPPTGTGLEVALRINNEPPTLPVVRNISEKDRYSVVESDPSQDEAIQCSRIAPGIVVEGPPGTGKSQTIVNIVADAVGRGESILVVCQKQAALKVVQKRLNAEGLKDRLFLVEDIVKDRNTIISSVRDQLTNIHIESERRNQLHHRREEVSSRIEAIETEIDRNHEAKHIIDDRSGYTYRELIGRLLTVESEGKFIDIPRLRIQFNNDNLSEIVSIEEACGSHALLWLKSNYENSLLSELKSFPVDEAVKMEVENEINTFCEFELIRSEIIPRTTNAFIADDITTYEVWLKENDYKFTNLSDSERIRLSAWLQIYSTENSLLPRSDKLVEKLEHAISIIENLEAEGYDQELFNYIKSIRLDEFKTKIENEHGLLARKFIENNYSGSVSPLLKEEICQNHVIDLEDRLQIFIQSEQYRIDTIVDSSNLFCIDDPDKFDMWFKNNYLMILSLNDRSIQCLGKWVHLFKKNQRAASRGDQILEDLRLVDVALTELETLNYNENILSEAVFFEDNKLEQLLLESQRYMKPQSIFDRINPFRINSRKKVSKILTDHHLNATAESLDVLYSTLALEKGLRSLRPKIAEALHDLFEIKETEPSSHIKIRFQTDQMLGELKIVAEAANAIFNYPLTDRALQAVRSQSVLGFEGLRKDYDASLRRHKAISDSVHILDELMQVFSDSWILSCKRNIFEDISTTEYTDKALKALNSLRFIESVKSIMIFESQLSEQRELIRITEKELAIGNDLTLTSPQSIILRAQELIRLIKHFRSAGVSVNNCPQKEELRKILKVSTLEAYVAFSQKLKNTIDRRSSIINSQKSLRILKAWFSDAFINYCEERINNNGTTSDVINPIKQALSDLLEYQRFRSLVNNSTFNQKTLKIFSILRQYENTLKAVSSWEVEGVVKRTIRREAYLAWKTDIETNFPQLLIDDSVIKGKVKLLTDLDNQNRKFTRELLGNLQLVDKIAPANSWNAITLLRGQNARRLREFFDHGKNLGLMYLRPIWLMNPDVVSRLLPLNAGLFDLVVFDEASQMLVEHSIPALYRAKRVVISGDEKQMPPTSFFSGRLDDDDDELDPEDLDETATDAERTLLEEKWNRREVKDCPDLLQLGRGVLPSTTLKIHYRSHYRELISFSNSAFYKNELSIPACHPVSEIKRAKPIEVIRVDGIYENQTNLSEAERITTLLKEFWLDESDTRPSIGIVTFNRKQADLVEDTIAKCAEQDPQFLKSLQKERDRKQDGEDMGFFVKNVENVQGDERDIIIFSTTFGRARKGGFRRNFGVLGQAGGERRLNVAITRARTKVLMVTSMPINEISDWIAIGRSPNKPRDYLQAYLEYSNKLSAGEIESARNTASRLSAGVSHNQSDNSVITDGFSQSVEQYISTLGYQPIKPTDSSDVFSLDFAIEDPRTGLFGIGIECDAPRKKLLKNARSREIWRQKVLSRSIPVVHRVSSHAWYHQHETEMLRLKEAINEALS